MKKTSENYLERIPVRSSKIAWSEEDGKVSLEIENTGFMNRVAQKFFKKPKISYIHLDELGGFVWKNTDGKTNIIDLGKAVEEKFGENAHPLYERLAKYFQVLESYHFISFK